MQKVWYNIYTNRKRKGRKMKQVKIYEYNADNFIKGRIATSSPRRVSKHLRRLLGLITYLKIRKYLTITEVEEWE
jgi:hypothetical protein